jgi:hypothetical protein
MIDTWMKIKLPSSGPHINNDFPVQKILIITAGKGTVKPRNSFKDIAFRLKLSNTKSGLKVAAFHLI